MRDQATTRQSLLTQLHLCNSVNKHARNQKTVGQELPLYAAQSAIEYSGFYRAKYRHGKQGVHSSTFETTREVDRGEVNLRTPAIEHFPTVHFLYTGGRKCDPSSNEWKMEKEM